MKSTQHQLSFNCNHYNRLGHLQPQDKLWSLQTVKLQLVNISYFSAALFTIFASVSLICIDAPLLSLPTNTQVMRELTLVSLHTLADLVERTQHGLGVDA